MLVNQLLLLDMDEDERVGVEKTHEELLMRVRKYPEAILNCASSDMDLFVENCSLELYDEIIGLYYSNCEGGKMSHEYDRLKREVTIS